MGRSPCPAGHWPVGRSAWDPGAGFSGTVSELWSTLELPPFSVGSSGHLRHKRWPSIPTDSHLAYLTPALLFWPGWERRSQAKHSQESGVWSLPRLGLSRLGCSLGDPLNIEPAGPGRRTAITSLVPVLRLTSQEHDVLSKAAPAVRGQSSHKGGLGKPELRAFCCLEQWLWPPPCPLRLPWVG